MGIYTSEILDRNLVNFETITKIIIIFKGNF